MHISEAQFQRQVTDLADRLGWQWLHIQRMGDPMGSWRTPTTGSLGKGWPDLLLVRRSTLIAAELKAQKAPYATELQRAVLQVLGNVTPHTYVWRPSDFPKIVEVLTNA